MLVKPAFTAMPPPLTQPCDQPRRKEKVFLLGKNFKKFILKIDMATSIFLNIIVQDGSYLVSGPAKVTS